MATVKRRECVYFYDEEMTNYNYGGNHAAASRQAHHTAGRMGMVLRIKCRFRHRERTREEIMLFHADGTPGGVGERVSYSSRHAQQHDMEPT